MKSISLYVDNGSYLTKIHPFTKMLYIVTAILAAVMSGKAVVYSAFILFSLVILVSGKLIKKVFPLIAFSFTILITIFLIHGLFNQANTQVLFRLGALKFYKEGLLYASNIGLNILNMLLSFAILVLTTKPSVLVDELEMAGMSPKLGYVIISVFQIVPQMIGTFHTITDAQRSRGLETEGKLVTRAKAFLPLISPVVMSGLINTRERAVALEVRGFGSKKKKTYLQRQEKTRIDYVVMGCLILCIIFAIVGRVLMWHS